MSANNQKPSGALTTDGRFTIDLTGPRSHTLVRQLGVGSLSIGPAELGKKADLHVPADASINWHVFDNFATPSGSPWPRFLYYKGRDARFFAWAQQRPIERMGWAPVISADTEVDARQSIISQLQINLEASSAQLSMQLPIADFSLAISGDPARFTATGNMPARLTLSPRTGRRSSDPPYRMPDLRQWKQVTHLTLSNEPMGQPISLACLNDFPNLASLSLWGNFSELEQLAGHVQLTNLELRFMPDLAGLPGLDTWPLLDRFIAYNVEENVGKRLRQQMRARAKKRPWSEHASVSQLRKPEWWAAEYGRPFASWPKRLAKQANEAYNAAQTALAEARTLAEAEAAITAFTVCFNGVKGIETSEREDLGEAVWQLSQSAPLISYPIPDELAQGWYDAARNY